METQVTNTHEIHLKLLDNIGSGTVKVIIMHDEGKNQPIVKKKQFGQFRGQIILSDDFDDVLEDTFWMGEIH